MDENEFILQDRLGVIRDTINKYGEENFYLSFSGGKVKGFMPLAKVSKDWEEWFINEYKIRLCELYYPPFNFERTGCKGCPYNIDIREELDTLTRCGLDNERRQCEYIWKPVYDEYRRIGYRLDREEQTKLF